VKYTLNLKDNKLELTQIITLIQLKDSKAEKALFLRFAPKVLTICRRYASQNVEAQDYMQECFILIFTKIHQFNPNKGSFEGWLHRVCTNRILELMRKSSTQVKISFPEHLPEPELTKKDLVAIPQNVILNAIQQLPSGYREVFNLYIFEGWSHRQIGKQLNIAETTSRSQLTRAKKLLQHLLSKKNYNRYERQLA